MDRDVSLELSELRRRLENSYAIHSGVIQIALSAPSVGVSPRPLPESEYMMIDSFDESTTAPSSPTLNINELPTELLTMILSDKRISLTKRIALRAVSTHWQDIIENYVLKKVTRLALNRKSDDANVPTLPFHDELLPLYARLFTALVELTVLIDETTYKVVAQLLPSFSATLTTLKLWQIIKKETDEVQWNINLARAINSLTALIDLDLYHTPTLLLTRLVPTLPRLQHLSYQTNNTAPIEDWQNITIGPLTNMTQLKILQPSTANYTAMLADTVVTFPSLTRLHLGVFIKHDDQSRIPRFIDLLRSLSTLEHLVDLKLTHIYYSSDQLTPPLQSDRRMTQLTKLTLEFRTPIASTELFTSALIAWAPSLEELTLIGFMFSFCLTTATLNNLARLDRLTTLVFDRHCHLEAPLFKPATRPLTSVKVLHLAINLDYPPDEPLCSSALVAWFPCLESLAIHFEANLPTIRTFPLTGTLLRHLSRLKHLTRLCLCGARFDRDQLTLPESDDQRLVNVEHLKLSVNHEPAYSPNGRYLFTGVAAWFPRLEELKLHFFDDGHDVFQPSITWFSELAHLEHLTFLSLYLLNYTKDRFTMPRPTDQVLIHVKKLEVDFGVCDENFDDKQHICSVIAAWFPNLESLFLDVFCEFGYQDPYPYRIYLTTSMLRDLSSLKHLRALTLPPVFYSPELQLPSETDLPLTIVHQLVLVVAGPVLNGEHLCTRLAAWLPRLEGLMIRFPYLRSRGGQYDDVHCMNTLAIYERAISRNLHHFYPNTVRVSY